MNYHWNWGILLEPSPDGQGTYLNMLLGGLRWTVLTSLAAWAVALVFGSLVGVMRTLPSWIAVHLGGAYIELFRNIPLLVQLFLWFFVIPELLPHDWGVWVKHLRYGAFYTAVVAIGLYMSARVATQVSAGINALPKGQSMAGTAIGLTPAQTYRYILLPMAYRIVLPPLTSEFLNTIKNTSVALTIGLMELTGAARSMQEFSFHVFEAFTAATVIYLALNAVVTIGMRALERALAVPGFNAAR
ncbi:amino acid ABC transporter permease [Azorhizobium doebereinerae]|uniref:amino acid ABC transporter permease n=1 Tax=Azorhizobium doebereinerae TaxID=281091 RepID=UPI000405D03A|nr:amino acid ABC transporter permease [Azorhizobium doebereinerae]